MKRTTDGTVTGLVQGATINGRRVGEHRNGLPGPRPYPYRGTKTLEAELPFECADGCGRRSNIKLPGGKPWTCTECHQ